MLREDKKIEMVRLPTTLPRLFMGRWALQVAQKVHPERWKDVVIEQWREKQQEHPVRLRVEGRRTLWWFRDRFYWDDDANSAKDIKALVLQRTRREQRRLASARALMQGEVTGPSGRRAPIPPHLARSVFARDGHNCVQCRASDDLQFDHIIPRRHERREPADSLRRLQPRQERRALVVTVAERRCPVHHRRRSCCSSITAALYRRRFFGCSDRKLRLPPNGSSAPLAPSR